MIIPKEKISIELQQGENEVTLSCEFCNKKVNGFIIVSKNNVIYQYSFGNKLQIHHLDGNKTNNIANNFRFLCKQCHTKFHDWGSLLTWLDKNNKTIEDLPKFRLKKMTYWRY